MFELDSLEIKVKGKEFILRPEYSGFKDSLQKYAKEKQKYVIGGFDQGLENGVLFSSPTGVIIDERLKVKLVPAEKRQSYIAGEKLKIFTIDDVRFLPVVCYEMIYPEVWLKYWGKLDFITHHVAFPMFDVFQYEGWKALEHAMSIIYKCPVYTICGGKKGEMNLTGTTLPSSTFDYHNLYKKHGKGWV